MGGRGRVIVILALGRGETRVACSDTVLVRFGRERMLHPNSAGSMLGGWYLGEGRRESGVRALREGEEGMGMGSGETG
jgi:hypothetical protein